MKSQYRVVVIGGGIVGATNNGNHTVGVAPKAQLVRLIIDGTLGGYKYDDGTLATAVTWLRTEAQELRTKGQPCGRGESTKFRWWNEICVSDAKDAGPVGHGALEEQASRLAARLVHLFEQILEVENARGAAMFVDDKGHVRLRLLHRRHHVVERGRLDSAEERAFAHRLPGFDSHLQHGSADLRADGGFIRRAQLALPVEDLEHDARVIRETADDGRIEAHILLEAHVCEVVEELAEPLGVGRHRPRVAFGQLGHDAR